MSPEDRKELLDEFSKSLVSSDRLNYPSSNLPADLEMVAYIESVFPDSFPSTGLTIIQGEMLDNGDDREPELFAEGSKIGRYSRWQDVPVTLIASYPGIYFLDDAGLLFYLPAVMRFEVLYGLKYAEASPADLLRDKFEENDPMFRALTDDQRLCIARWDSFLRARYGHPSTH